MDHHTFTYGTSFTLENGQELPGFQLAYSTEGQLNEARDNVIWVCHALTGNAHMTEWWPGLFGPDEVFDTRRYFVICANMLGSCYGSTYALSINAHTGRPFYHDFPLLSNRDIVRAFDLLREHLELDRIHVITGGSTGGQHALEWAVSRPEVFEHLIPIATNARHSPWGIACNESQRMAIAADASWSQEHPDAGKEGMRAARAMALITYRSYEGYAARQPEDNDDKLDHFRASSYQQYQGEKLYRRFDAFAYWTLSKAMDSHNVGRGRGGVGAALGQIKARTLVLGVSSDVLFPPEEQRFLAKHIPGARYEEIYSIYGHDGFLVESVVLSRLIRHFLSASSLD